MTSLNTSLDDVAEGFSEIFTNKGGSMLETIWGEETRPPQARNEYLPDGMVWVLVGTLRDFTIFYSFCNGDHAECFGCEKDGVEYNDIGFFCIREDPQTSSRTIVNVEFNVVHYTCDCLKDHEDKDFSVPFGKDIAEHLIDSIRGAEDARTNTHRFYVDVFDNGYEARYRRDPVEIET